MDLRQAGSSASIASNCFSVIALTPSALHARAPPPASRACMHGSVIGPATHLERHRRTSSSKRRPTRTQCWRQQRWRRRRIRGTDDLTCVVVGHLAVPLVLDTRVGQPIPDCEPFEVDLLVAGRKLPIALPNSVRHAARRRGCQWGRGRGSGEVSVHREVEINWNGKTKPFYCAGVGLFFKTQPVVSEGGRGESTAVRVVDF